MKKIIYAFLALVLISSSFLLAGCNEEDKFWEKTNTEVTEFVTKESNAFLVSESTVLAYPEAIEELIGNNEKYGELTTYYSIVKSLMAMFNKQHVNLAVLPTVNKETKNHYKKFEEELDDLQSAIKTFLLKKASFEEHVAVLGNYTDASALQELTLYKREMTKLINEALEFNQAFENLYQNAYLSIPTKQITLYHAGYENLILSVNVNKILRSYVTYVFDDGDNLIHANTNNNALTQINRIKEKMIAGVYKENTLATINEITIYTLMFDNEITNFYTALGKVNIADLTKDGESQYLTANPKLTSFVNEINRFNNNVITLFTNKLLELCA